MILRIPKKIIVTSNQIGGHCPMFLTWFFLLATHILNAVKMYKMASFFEFFFETRPVSDWPWWPSGLSCQ